MNTPDYIQQFREKFLHVHHPLIHAENIIQNPAELESFITTLVSEAEARGANRAVDYIHEQLETEDEGGMNEDGRVDLSELGDWLESARNAKPV